MLTTGRVRLSTSPRGRPTPPWPTPRAEWCQTPLDAEPARIRAVGLNVHLVDGTYELFRHHFPPANRAPEATATRGRGALGRGACWERVCQYVRVLVVAGALKKKN